MSVTFEGLDVVASRDFSTSSSFVTSQFLVNCLRRRSVVLNVHQSTCILDSLWFRLLLEYLDSMSRASQPGPDSRLPVLSSYHPSFQLPTFKSEVLHHETSTDHRQFVVKNPSDFVGAYLGHTEKNTKAILDSTVGKVLVIDETHHTSPPTAQASTSSSYLNPYLQFYIYSTRAAAQARAEPKPAVTGGFGPAWGPLPNDRDRIFCVTHKWLPALATPRRVVIFWRVRSIVRESECLFICCMDNSSRGSEARYSSTEAYG
ncbi:hypothetical protein F4604DRAFT_1685789 [Suillus subluteus]|nr:hypothetical protein F4604DRAFT_1690317 [Suillus subluteus]KAG1855309.1 hypothetical protein F4604DRAFT_1685789 [Suillus subluteus]